MDPALKRMVSRHLRPAGFQGSLPHFRRLDPERIDLLSIQYLSSGGSFVAEVASCPPEGLITPWGKHIPPNNVRAKEVPHHRARLGSPTFPVGDHWFRFGPRNYEPEASRVESSDFYDDVASTVAMYVTSQAESFWRSA